MRTILTIAKREITRLRSHFRGGSRPIVLLILVGAAILAFLIFRQTPNVGAPGLGEGLYRAGVSPDAPRIADRRFTTVVLGPAQAREALANKTIDVYLDSERVFTRNEARSQYAAGALKRYLEKQELARLSAAYDLADAFPLRIEVNTLTVTASGGASVPGPSLADLLSVAPSSAPEGGAPASGVTPPNPSDDAVREQIRQAGGGVPPLGGMSPLGGASPLKVASGPNILIPSLTEPPIPFAQVLLAFVYVLPVSFVSVFFTSSFMDEKTNRRLTILMSAPVTPFQIIVGKLLPYLAFALVSAIVVAVVTRVNPLLALAILAPIILFIFAIYLMVPLLYRTFKDTTFISMLATAVITSYLIFPAMFSGINDLAYISPLTLAVRLYRAEPFGLREYLFSAVPMCLIFALSVYAGTRMLNEEFLMAYRPLLRKLADALYLIMNPRHPYLSVLALSLLFIPAVFMIQLVTLAISLNLPIPFALGGTLVAAAIVEEAAKAAGIMALLEHHVIRSAKQVVALAFLSALGFLLGEKGLLYISLGIVSQSALSAALFNSGALLTPLLAHFVFTTVVGLLARRPGLRYRYAVLAGAIVHTLYNFILIGGVRELF